MMQLHKICRVSNLYTKETLNSNKCLSDFIKNYKNFFLFKIILLLFFNNYHFALYYFTLIRLPASRAENEMLSHDTNKKPNKIQEESTVDKVPSNCFGYFQDYLCAQSIARTG